MSKKIVILGDLSEADLERIDTAAHHFNYEIMVAGSGGDVSATQGEPPPLAYFSFFDCTPARVIEQFGRLPVGTGEKIPYFQRIDRTIPPFALELPIAGFFEVPISNAVIFSLLRAVDRNEKLLAQQRGLSNQVADIRNETGQLVEIGAALSRETELKNLLKLILNICQRKVHADAGSVYVRERSTPGGPFTDYLVFMVAQNDSVDTEKGSHYRLHIDNESIAGYVASTGRSLTIDDVATMGSNLPFRASSTFQSHFEYRTKSMLTVPLKNLDHEVVGILQLINRKDHPDIKLSNAKLIDDHVQTFSRDDEVLVQSIAPFAAVSIERTQLYENINGLFEGFLNASIASIDERDRVTSGHSRRVMGYAMAFVDAAEADPDHQFHELCTPPERRRQFQFAALLHDIGKIGVPEYVLNKEFRLSTAQFDLLMAQIDYIEARQAVDPASVSWATVEELEQDRAFLFRMNRSGRMDEVDRSNLLKLSRKTYRDAKGVTVPLLSAYASESLGIARGNLTSAERELINSHAKSTLRILSQIPWTGPLSNVPLIAAQHHERIDGSGYPDGITGDAMFLESKILAVIDIYEALVAQDRPYKPKMSPQAAIAILDAEVNARHIDGEVVRFFVEKGIYRLFSDPTVDAQ